MYREGVFDREGCAYTPLPVGKDIHASGMAELYNVPGRPCILYGASMYITAYLTGRGAYNVPDRPCILYGASMYITAYHTGRGVYNVPPLYIIWGVHIHYGVSHREGGI